MENIEDIITRMQNQRANKPKSHDDLWMALHVIAEEIDRLKEPRNEEG